jgi:hypothetical protein
MLITWALSSTSDACSRAKIVTRVSNENNFICNECSPDSPLSIFVPSCTNAALDIDSAVEGGILQWIEGDQKADVVDARRGLKVMGVGRGAAGVVIIVVEEKETDDADDKAGDVVDDDNAVEDGANDNNCWYDDDDEIDNNAAGEGEENDDDGNNNGGGGGCCRGFPVASWRTFVPVNN